MVGGLNDISNPLSQVERMYSRLHNSGHICDRQDCSSLQQQLGTHWDQEMWSRKGFPSIRFFFFVREAAESLAGTRMCFSCERCFHKLRRAVRSGLQ
jgi:hypothetical protein